MGYVWQPRGRGIFMMQYSVDGVAVRESTGTDDEKQALKILHAKETDRDRGLPVGPGVGKITFDDAVEGIRDDYAINDQSSWAHQERRIRLHLAPVFGGWLMKDIKVKHIKAYTSMRRAAGAAAGTVNRELDALRRMFTLAVQGEQLLYQPYVPRLDESGSVRSGFFEPAAFASVRRHLPASLQPVMTLAYVTGWRIDSEILTLEWRQVDLAAGEFRLDASMTKNRRPRVFRMTADLRALFLERQAARDAVLKTGHVCPWVFFRLVRTGSAGLSAQHRRRAAIVPTPKRIKRFQKAWKAACRAAGVPARIPHDFRRTAIRNMVRRGVPERVAMQMSGHLTRSVFDRYNIVSEGDLVLAAERLEGLAPAVKDLTDTQTDTQPAESLSPSSNPLGNMGKVGGAAQI